MTVQYIYKRDQTGTIVSRKALYAVVDDLMTPNTHLDTNKINSNSADLATIHLLLSPAVSLNLKCEHFYINSAFITYNYS